jgi:hypothetical protein
MIRPYGEWRVKTDLKWSELRYDVRSLQLTGVVRLGDAMGAGEIIVHQRYVAGGLTLLPGMLDWELFTNTDPAGDMFAEMQMNFQGHGLRLDGRVF